MKMQFSPIKMQKIEIFADFEYFVLLTSIIQFIILDLMILHNVDLTTMTEPLSIWSYIQSIKIDFLAMKKNDDYILLWSFG